MPERERVYVRHDQDIHSIIDAVSQAESSEVDIVVPSGARILQNIVDAYLLKDAVAQAGKTVRLATNDVMGATFAERAGIKTVSLDESEDREVIEPQETIRPVTAMARSVKKSGMSDIVPKSKKIAPKKKVSLKKSSAAPIDSPPRTVVGRKEVAESKFLQNYNKPREGSFETLSFPKRKGGKKRLSAGKIITIIVVVTLFAAGAVFAQILPKAQVTIVPKKESQSFTVDIKVDKDAADASVENGIVPGEFLIDESTVSGEFKATGSESASDRARGTITIYNEFSAQPQTFIPSRFQAENGLIFRTQQNVTVPGATIKNGAVVTPGTVQAVVVADGAGSQYAIGPSKFTMPALAGTDRGEKIYGRSTEAFSGGNPGANTVVSENNAEQAYSALREKALKESGISETLPEGLSVWSEATNSELADQSVNPSVGSRADMFTASVKVIERAVAFRQSDYEKVVDETILSKLDAAKTILPKSKKIVFAKPPVVDYAAGTVTAQIQVTVDVIDKIDAESFRGAVVNKDRDEIDKLIDSYRGIEGVKVRLSPFWVGSVPGNEERVKVNIEGM